MTAADVTLRPADPTIRLGLKGANAAAWLAAQGVPTPPAPNRWRPHAGGVCLRLGIGEYFVSGAADGARLAAALAPAAGVYPVLRQDAALVLAGPAAGAVLEQSCAVDFRAASLGDDAVVLTSMLGIGVQVIWQTDGSARAYHLWCDASFGSYFAAALTEIVRDLGGSTSLKAGGKG
jgi:sarcosine oxidase subunit gamma